MVIDAIFETFKCFLISVTISDGPICYTLLEEDNRTLSTITVRSILHYVIFSCIYKLGVIMACM